jgi:hypothetical protein
VVAGTNSPFVTEKQLVPNSKTKQLSKMTTTWLVSFMQYDLGYFAQETCRLEPIENPFSVKVLPMSPA